MAKLGMSHWLLLSATVLSGFGFFNANATGMDEAAPLAKTAIDGTEAGLTDFFTKTCVQLRDLTWALVKLRRNVDSCGWQGNSDCAENHAMSVTWLVKLKQGGVARVEYDRQIATTTDWSFYNFGGKPDCLIRVPEAYGRALQQVPSHFRNLHAIPLSPKGMELDVLTHWRTSNDKLRLWVSHYRDNGVPEDNQVKDPSLQAMHDLLEAENEARPWEISYHQDR